MKKRWYIMKSNPVGESEILHRLLIVGGPYVLEDAQIIVLHKIKNKKTDTEIYTILEHIGEI